jgi:succinate dehydrogenase flavin-adding protein (antitoxin of CptAB toxin-antitoxin module)
MKELDLLLAAWLDRGWPVANDIRRQAFERLLDEADPQLAAWLIGGLRPVDAVLAGLIDEIIRVRH